MRALHVDHTQPIAEGGALYDLENLSTKCAKCHEAKTRLENTISIPEQDRLMEVLERVLTESV